MPKFNCTYVVKKRITLASDSALQVALLLRAYARSQGIPDEDLTILSVIEDGQEALVSDLSAYRNEPDKPPPAPPTSPTPGTPTIRAHTKLEAIAA